MKIRVSFDVDVTNETMYSSERMEDGTSIKVPITAENALEWYQFAFDAYPSNYIEGFITNQKAEVYEPCTCGLKDECLPNCMYGKSTIKGSFP